MDFSTKTYTACHQSVWWRAISNESSVILMPDAEVFNTSSYQYRPESERHRYDGVNIARTFAASSVYAAIPAGILHTRPSVRREEVMIGPWLRVVRIPQLTRTVLQKAQTPFCVRCLSLQRLDPALIYAALLLWTIFFFRLELCLHNRSNDVHNVITNLKRICSKKVLSCYLEGPPCRNPGVGEYIHIELERYCKKRYKGVYIYSVAQQRADDSTTL